MNVFAGMMRYIGRDRTLADVDLKVFHRQQREYELEERKLAQELLKFENEQQKLLAEYKLARDNNKRSQVDFIARQFESRQEKRRDLDSQHVFLIRQRKVLQQMIRLKENAEWSQRLGAGKWLNVPLEDLPTIIEEELNKQESDNSVFDEVLDRVRGHQEAVAMQQPDTSETRAHMDSLVDDLELSGKVDAEISSIDRALEESRKGKQLDRPKSRDEPQ